MDNNKMDNLLFFKNEKKIKTKIFVVITMQITKIGSNKIYCR